MSRRTDQLLRRGASAWQGLRADSWLIAVDALLVAVAYLVALVLRFDGHVPHVYWHGLPTFVLLATVVHVALLSSAGLYGRVWVQAGVVEVRPLVVATASATGVLLVADLLTGQERMLPLSVPLNAGVLVLLLFAGLRYRERLVAARAVPCPDGTGVVLVGRVGSARHVLAQMRTDHGTGLVPLAVVTDEVAAWRRTLDGVPVTGPVSRLPEVARAAGAEQVLLVLGDEPTALRRIVGMATDAGLRPRVLPSLRETMGRPPTLRDVRDLRIEDLLGREQVDVDVAALRQTFAGRRVLITGAGGSIGREIAAQVSRLDPGELLLLDHDETHLHEAVAPLSGPVRCVLGDIRDEAFVQRLFEETRPQVVFHAAAHKHVPILEDFPSEAVRTNVLGTDLLVRAAVRYGTQHFVAISTDKAVEPSCVMGASKRLAEQLVVHQRPEGRQFCAVRFGNVLGSRGSVIPTFLRQVQEGGPVTVTHPDMTRFFMSVREAVELVMQAASISDGGEVFMLDMGTPVRIVDLAERIISLSGGDAAGDVRIAFTGLRPGEKLTEQLHSDDESVHPTSHPKIHLVRSPQCAGEVLVRATGELRRLATSGEQAPVRRLLVEELARMPAVVDLDGPSPSAPNAPARVDLPAPRGARATL